MKNLKKKLLMPVAIATIFFLGFESGAFQLALLRVATSFNLGQFAMGLLVAAQCIAVMVAPIIFGRISDRLGKKKVLLVSVPALALGCLIAALSPSVFVFIPGVFIIGMGFSVTESVMSAWLADNSGGDAARYLNISQSGFGFGAVAGPIVSSWLMDGLGFEWGSVFIATAAGIMFVYPFLLATPKDKTPTAPVRKQGTGHSSEKSLFANRYFLTLFVLLVTYIGVESGLAFFADSMFTLGFDQGSLSAYAISIFWFTMAISRIVSSFIKLDARRLLLVYFPVSAALFVAMSMLTSGYAALAIIAVAGFLCGPLWPVIVSQGTAEFPERTGAAAGAMSVAGGLGSTVVPILMGLISEYLGIAFSYAFLAVICALATIIALLSKRRAHK